MTEEAPKVSPLEVHPQKDVSYINLTLLDASKTIQASIKEKLSDKEQLSKIWFPYVRRVLSKEKVQDKIAAIAGEKVKPSMVAKGLSDMMPKLIMYMIHQKVGILVAARTVFVEDAYIVIEFQVKNVDTQKLLQKIQEGIPEDMDDEDLEVPPEVLEAWMQKMEQDGEALPSDPEAEAAPAESTPDATDGSDGSDWSWSGWLAKQSEYVITQLLPTDTKKGLEQDTMPPVVQKKITEEMGAMMEKKMAQKQLEAEIAVLPAETQARYFFSNLETLRARNKK